MNDSKKEATNSTYISEVIVSLDNIDSKLARNNRLLLDSLSRFDSSNESSGKADYIEDEDSIGEPDNRSKINLIIGDIYRRLDMLESNIELINQII